MYQYELVRDDMEWSYAVPLLHRKEFTDDEFEVMVREALAAIGEWRPTRTVTEAIPGHRYMNDDRDGVLRWLVENKGFNLKVTATADVTEEAHKLTMADREAHPDAPIPEKLRRELTYIDKLAAQMTQSMVERAVMAGLTDKGD
jgi:hypothetical protein